MSITAVAPGYIEPSEPGAPQSPVPNPNPMPDPSAPDVPAPPVEEPTPGVPAGSPGSDPIPPVRM